MSTDRPQRPSDVPPKPGRKISFVVPRNKGHGEILVEGAWLYEGAELELAKRERLGELAGDLWCEGKLHYDDERGFYAGAPLPAPPSTPSGETEVALQAFDSSRSTERLEPLMRSIGSTISQVSEYVDSIPEGVGMEAGSDAVEALLGSAFVLCQSHMNAVLLRVDAIKRLVRRRKALASGLLAKSRLSLLEIPSPRMIGRYSLTQVVWALADYCKQSNGWPTNWASAKGDARKTIDIIAAAGIAQHGRAGLRTAAKTLGVTQYRHLDLLSLICEHWGNVLNEDVRRVCGIKA